MDIQGKPVDMDLDMGGKFRVHGKPDTTPNIQLECLGDRCELPSGVWDGAEPPSKIEFGAL